MAEPVGTFWARAQERMTCSVCGKIQRRQHGTRMCHECWSWAYNQNICVRFDELAWRYRGEAHTGRSPEEVAR